MDINFIGELVGQGVLGILLAICIGALYILFKLLMQEKDKRIMDAQDYNNKLMGPIEQIKENGQTQITLLRQFLEKVKGV